MGGSRRSRAKVAGPKEIRHDDTVPEPCQAAQVAVLVMKAVGVSRWDHVFERAQSEDLREAVVLTPEQQSLIDRYADVLPFLRVRPLTTITACDTCGSYGLVSGGAPSRCYLTLRCEGKMVKASSMASRKK